MIDLTRPALAAAGLLAALVPLVLHLISRKPRERVALPTARFLSPHARVSVRFRRRPSDLLLLALRMLLLLLAGLGLAGPAWHPDRGGTAEVVLLDRGRGMREGDAWRRAVEEARRRLVDPTGRVRGDLVLFDTTAIHLPARALTVASFDSLAAAAPPDVPSDYTAALRGLAAAGGALRGADSARATLLTVPGWDGWRPGTAAIRRAAWPGALAIPALGSAGDAPRLASTGEPRRPGAALLLARSDGGEYVTAALEATGWSVRRASPDTARMDPAGLIVVLAPPSPELARRIGERVRAGATILASPGAVDGDLAPLLPWQAAGEDDRSGGAIRFGAELRLEGAATRAAGRPRDGATTLAAWDDGRPAAVAAPVARGCAVVVAAPLEGGRLPLAADYPRSLDRLARGCHDAAADGVVVDGRLPLDSGALAVLRLADRPATVAASAVAGAGGGVPLGRWVLAAALMVALVETVLAYGRRGAYPAA